jgi:hypothetical protein
MQIATQPPGIIITAATTTIDKITAIIAITTNIDTIIHSTPQNGYKTHSNTFNSLNNSNKHSSPKDYSNKPIDPIIVDKYGTICNFY